jgi:hypothetical protein
LARYHDFVGEKPSISGFLFSNPAWKNTWREHLENLRYFRTDFNFPLMIAQHRDDRALVTDVEIAKKILETSCPPRAKYTELSGGIDQGLPHFSMGHHGFRGIESLLTDAMRDFVNSNTEVLDTNGLPK